MRGGTGQSTQRAVGLTSRGLAGTGSMPQAVREPREQINTIGAGLNVSPS
jgi:hypothetical protein